MNSSLEFIEGNAALYIIKYKKAVPLLKGETA
jgi:hypothetical protein